MLLMVDSTDHVTGKTGLTLTITVSKAGAAFASITPTVTERGSGWYSLALTSAHLDTLGDLAIHAVGTAADPSDALLEVVAYDQNDSAALGLSRIDTTISTRALEAGGNVATILSRHIGTIAAGTHNAQTGDAYARLGAPTLASIAADIQARLSSAGYTAPDNASIATILGRVIGTLAAGTHNPQTGDSFARLGATGSGLTSLASAANLLTANSNVSAIKAKTDNLPAAPAAVGSAMGLSSNALTAAALDQTAVDEIVDQVWNELLSGHLAIGSTGAALNASGGSGDPWSTSLPGAYGAGSAGFIIGSMIDAAISSRLAAIGYTSPDNVGISSIKAKTDNLPATPASEATVASRLASASYTAPDNVSISSIKAKTDSLPIDPASEATVASRLAAVDYDAPDNVGIAALSSSLEVVKKMVSNKVVTTGNIVQIYEDDGLTVWRTYDLTDGGRLPI